MSNEKHVHDAPFSRERFQYCANPENGLDILMPWLTTENLIEVTNIFTANRSIILQNHSKKIVSFNVSGQRGQGKIHSLSVDLCSSEPCHTVANTVYTVKVNFTASVGSKSLRNVLHIIFAGVPLPWNINPTDACGNRVHCPLQRGLAQVFTVTVETPKLLEFSGGIVGKWEVKDENDRNVMCIAYGVVFNA